MNYIQAACRHFVPAVGAPGSLMRSLVEFGPCPKCDTDEWWSRQYDEAEAVPMSPERIQEIVDNVLSKSKEQS